MFVTVFTGTCTCAFKSNGVHVAEGMNGALVLAFAVAGYGDGGGLVPTFTPGGLAGITDPLLGASYTFPDGSFHHSLIGLLPVDRGTGGGGVVLDSTAMTPTGHTVGATGAVYSYRSEDGSAMNITCEKPALIPS